MEEVKDRVHLIGFSARYDKWIEVCNNIYSFCTRKEYVQIHPVIMDIILHIHTQSLLRIWYKFGSCTVYSNKRKQLINIGYDSGLVMYTDTNYEWNDYKQECKTKINSNILSYYN